MKRSRLRDALVVAVGAALAGLTALSAAGPASAAPSAAATYTITLGPTGSYDYPSDTPASPYIDKDGTFYFQQSVSSYAATDPRNWEFYSGTDFDTATKNTAISDAVNPANSADRNDDTTWRCDNSPTGLTATPAPAGSRYSQRNFCDLVGVWVDPDTGDWYGLVHNEFTPEPFGAYSFSHYDSIDYAVSKDQGKVWSILGHAITSPYSTTRGDTTAFPQQTFDYGDGDPRLFVDQASGYFYVYYGSRIVPKAGTPGAFAGLQHVARAPMSAKMATGSWQKWYDGSWSQPGVGGLESDMVPVTAANPNGYAAVADDYNPANPGTTEQQVAAGTLPGQQSDLFITNITYDAYLGLYIGEPAVQTSPSPQKYYVTDDLATQKWRLIGDSGSVTSGSWYRWIVDAANRTNPSVVGKTFRSYCAIACTSSDGEYADVTIDTSSAAAAPLDVTRVHTIATGAGRVLAQVAGTPATTAVVPGTPSALQAWAFTPIGDGSYRITNATSGQVLGVDSTVNAGRAWGAKPTVSALGAGGATVGQQWWIIADKSPAGAPDGTYRLVNRYSGLALSLSADPGRGADTTPVRNWTNATGDLVGGSRTAAEQTLAFPVAHIAGPEAVTVAAPGAQTGTAGSAVSLQITGIDSKNRALTYSATGLPAGLVISSTGLITGAPKSPGDSVVTVTASSQNASARTTFDWTVAAARIPQTTMTVKYADSEETAGENGAAANVLDGKATTNWVTAWSSGTAPLPHEIQLDLGRSYAVTDLYYLPRQDNVNGRIARYQVFVSSDGVTWGAPVASGTFPNTAAEQDVHFAAAQGRYVRLVALSEVGGNPWTAVAELNVVGS